MSLAFSSRRRAEQFDALLEGTLTQAPSTELAELLAFADEVRALPEVAPRADFTADLRERLMAEATTALAAPAPGATTARLTVGRTTPRSSTRERRIGLAIAAFSVIGATTVSAVASQGTVPGDTLYPVKRLLEDARTSLAMGDDAKADSLLSQARTRLAEARELGTRDDVDAARVDQTLRDFGDAADHASAILLAEYADHGDPQDIDELRTFTQQSVDTLSGLVGLVPASVDETLSDVVNTLIAIDQSAAQACPSCSGAGITELPSQLVDLLSSTSGQASESAGVAASPTSEHPRRHKTGKSKARAPSSGASQGGAQGAQPGGPLGGVTGGLTGGNAVQPSGGATSVGGAVGGAGAAVGGAVSGVGGAVGGLGDQLGGPVGGAVGDVGGAVGDVGGTVGGVTGGVGDTVDGVVGGLLGTQPTQTPSP